MTGTVWFVGAGPGDPELLTYKAVQLLQQADAVLFAGSLVSDAATRWAPANCEIADSKAMTLDKICSWLIDRAQRHKTVIRLQTGDPGLYGALVEMIQPLDAARIPVKVIPGVTSATASAAAAVETLTLPEVTQTVILTRVEGRTPMPDGESLQALAAHHCTLCLYLSITLLKTVRSELLAAGWRDDSPVLVVQKASWPGQEKILRGTLADIRQRCIGEGVTAQAMIIVSPALGARHHTDIKKSRLYDPGFSHRFRKASNAGISHD